MKGEILNKSWKGRGEGAVAESYSSRSLSFSLDRSKERVDSGESSINKSVFLDQAYNEYCQLRADGEDPDLIAFCARFPAHRTALLDLLTVHKFVEERPDLLGKEGEDGSPTVWPEPGEAFLGFTLLRELGRGAFARVFLAEEPALGNRRVAVKIGTHGAAEAEIQGRLNHSNIVPIHSIRRDPQSNLTAVCMPFLGASTLADVLTRMSALPNLPLKASLLREVARGTEDAKDLALETTPESWRLPKQSHVAAVVHLGVQLAEALASMHAQGILHRDLKPSNVLLTPSGRPLLLDFNLSIDQQAARGRLGGTMPYMPPEQLRASDPVTPYDPSQVDARSDLFSLGVILFEMLTRSHPFGPIPSDLKPSEVRALLLERQPDGPLALLRLNPQVDPLLAQIVEKCLAFDPARRPCSAKELAAALRKTQTLGHRARRWAMRHPAVLIPLALLTFGASFAGAIAVAAREPYAVRQYQEAEKQYHLGNYRLALQYLDSALDKDPNLLEALILRGKTHHRLSQEEKDSVGQLRELGLALADYEKSKAGKDDMRILNLQAYCNARRQQHRLAIQQYEPVRVLIPTAEVYNNLACCLQRVNIGGSVVLDLTDNAVEIAPPNQIALCKSNQLLIHCRIVLDRLKKPLPEFQCVVRGLFPGTDSLLGTRADLALRESLKKLLIPDPAKPSELVLIDPLQADKD